MAAPIDDNKSINMSGMSSAKHIILVLSGKGGVGKSTVTTQLALGLVHAGKKVGILDIDLCGPSIPTMLNLVGHQVHQCDQGWVPVYADKDQRLSVMSIGFLLDKQDDAVVWRGPKKTAMISQFVSDVVWGDIDYLLIDTPPGTSDEHLSIVTNLKSYAIDGAILVTTPQAVAVGDVRRELTFCRKASINVIGVIENMSGYVCTHCKECTNVFSKGGGQALAEKFNIPFLGCIQLDPQLARNLETGGSFVDLFPESLTRSAITNVVLQVINR